MIVIILEDTETAEETNTEECLERAAAEINRSN
jgi:hypothetical protein